MLNRPVAKHAYQHDPNVRGFANWLSANLSTSALAHSYFDFDSGTVIRFNSVHDACRQYAWNHSGVTVPHWAAGGVASVSAGRTLSSNTQALAALAKLLGLASNDSEMLDACLAVCRWGGVLNGNLAWLHGNQAGLRQRILNMNLDLQNAATHGGGVLLPANLRFNSAMTKVHSLMVNNFVIYDSRVAAALGLAVRRWLNTGAGPSPAPRVLSFPWAPGRIRSDGTQPLRNAQQLKAKSGTAALVLNRFTANPVRHVWANLYASWLLELVLPAWGATLRDLEAALFMIGYDIDQASPANTACCVARLPLNRRRSINARSALQA